MGGARTAEQLNNLTDQEIDYTLLGFPGYNTKNLPVDKVKAERERRKAGGLYTQAYMDASQEINGVLAPLRFAAGRPNAISYIKAANQVRRDRGYYPKLEDPKTKQRAFKEAFMPEFMRQAKGFFTGPFILAGRGLNWLGNKLSK